MMSPDPRLTETPDGGSAPEGSALEEEVPQTAAGRGAAAEGPPAPIGPRRVRVLERAGRVRIGVSAAVVLVLLILAGAAIVAAARSTSGTATTVVPLDAGSTQPSGGVSSDGAASDEAASDQAASDQASSDGAAETIYVHVLGAVAEPGLYTLATDARVVDAIAAAGGFSADADTGSVNLARTLGDGEQIIVTRPGEAPPPGADGGAVGGGDGATAPGTPVNLNSATAAELESLPRIGPALAERIIAWRTENGPFRLVDELLSVAGIGDAILAGLDGLVTL